MIPFENCSIPHDSAIKLQQETYTTKALTDVLPRGIQRVEVVQVRESAEELLRAAHLVADDETALARALDLEDFDDGSKALLDIPHHALVDLERVLASLLQEDGV